MPFRSQGNRIIFTDGGKSIGRNCARAFAAASRELSFGRQAELEAITAQVVFSGYERAPIAAAL
jgi:hypothetical protein